MLDLLRGLRSITATPRRGCTRLAYTPFEDQAHDYVWERLCSISGLQRIDDAAGNTFIVPPSAVEDGSPIVLMGSHLDTVIEGGWLDGSLGVAAAVHVVESRARGGHADHHLGLVIFRDEEGVRFSTGLFGSKVLAGECTTIDLDVSDSGGTSVREVVPDPDGCFSYRPPVNAAAFLECHIEQGERLIESGTRIGVVSGIVGIRRFELEAIGMANHAGTTDMRRRTDALVPVADIVARCPNIVDDLDDAVITCGRLTVDPGAPNIVPGRAAAIIEIRGRDDATLDNIERRLRDMVSSLRPAVAGGRRADVDLRPLVSVAPNPTDETLSNLLISVLNDRGVAFNRLASMAGHDTQQAARRCPSAMFFIPSIDGVSHNPDENSPEEDILLAGVLMDSWADRWIAECS